MYCFTGGRDAEGRPLKFIPGVPARDLTNAEWEALTREQRDLARDQHIYRYKRDPKPRPVVVAPEPAPEPAPELAPEVLEHAADDQADEPAPAEPEATKED